VINYIRNGNGNANSNRSSLGAHGSVVGWGSMQYAAGLYTQRYTGYSSEGGGSTSTTRPHSSSNNNNNKSKYVPALRKEDVWCSGCVDPCILDLDTRWTWVVSFMLRPLYVEKRKILYLSEHEWRPLGRPDHSQWLHRLCYPVIIIIIIIITITIQFNSILYYFCAEPTATRPITGTAQCRYR
jgi:hypothetical protein